MEQAKRDKILQAAVREFARHGFKKASIESIAEAAGVGKGTIYLAAETKEDLFYQAVHREVRAWTASVGRHIDPSRTAEELLLECAALGFQYLEDHPLVRELLFGAHNQILHDMPDRLAQLQELGLGNIVEILRVGVRQGRFRAELDVPAVAQIIEDVMVSTHLFHGVGARSKGQFLERVRVGLDLLLNGIRVRSIA
jgi:AcrR family transcriptional regulator